MGVWSLTAQAITKEKKPVSYAIHTQQKRKIARRVFPDLDLHVGLQLVQVLALLADLLL
jgi:hypothetical protein